MTNNTENAALQLAQAYIDTTNTIVFLTGKAGTGKTTFLRQVRQTSSKKLAIIAPTGVAAINAGGMTIHSLFQLPFGPLLPNMAGRPEISYSTEKRALLQSLELLIIDEISMVRPDVLDQVDLILRNVRGSTHSFGGVQLLLIGDLAQLSPIIRDEEWSLLRKYYGTPYFFSSLVLQKADYIRIELAKVYRQSDPAFVKILNEMREQTLSEQSIKRLNEHYRPDFRPTPGDGFITLTTHNKNAQAINQEWLDQLETPETEYKATIRGEFPADSYPTDVSLKLKVGAQVMFVKNDSSAEKKYYNGKIGTVTNLTADTVTVEAAGQPIELQAVEWTNVKYQAGEDEQIAEQNAGSFAQIPLKTAWAITVHKSQGLTFDKAIIDVSAAFTHGQAYVALTRCRSLDGLVLLKPLSLHNVIGDRSVRAFNQKAEQRKPDQDSLKNHQEAYRLYLLSELFNFTQLQDKAAKFSHLLPGLETEILAVAGKLGRQLSICSDERVQKAAAYFKDQLIAISQTLHDQLTQTIGSSKDLAGKADELLNWMLTKIDLLNIFCQVKFRPETYLELRNQKRKGRHSYLKALNAKPNEALYEDLKDWRDQTARTEQVLESMLFTEQTLAAIAAKLPATLKALSGIKGVGPEKTSRYGAAILTRVRDYQQGLTGTSDQGSLF